MEPRLEECQKAALRFLAQRMHSTEEMRVKLRRRGFFSEEIEKVLRDLKLQKLLSDRRFALELTRQSRYLRDHGALRIRKELQRRGVDPNYIREAVSAEGVWSEENERELALSSARKKIETSHGLPEKKMWRRVAGHLERRGFSSEIIASTLEELRSMGAVSSDSKN